MARTPSTRSFPVAAALALGAAAVMLWRQAAYGMLGADTFPILLTSRVRTFADALGNVTERLMDGRYSSAFWRPVLNWSFAVDEWIWGLDPFGFQVTNVLIWAACGLALWPVLRRLTGSGWIAVIASAVYFLHPVHVEVLPVPARRSEYLCALFMLVALAGHRRWVVTAAATCLAVGSKETALALPALVFAFAWLDGESPRRALRAAAAPAAVAVAMFAARATVLGGLGGHGWEGSAQLPAAFGRMLRMFVMPQPATDVAPGSTFALALVGLGALLTAWLAFESRRVAGALEARRAAAAAVSWILVFGAAYAAGGEAYWQRLLPVIGWAMLLAAIVQALAVAARATTLDLPLRGAAWVTLVGCVALAAWHASSSPLVRSYGEWDRGSSALTEFFDETRAAVDQQPDGTMIDAPPLPFWVDAAAHGPVVCSAVLLTGYSVQAWAELVVPERTVTVVSIDDVGRQPRSDELLLMVSGRRDGFKGRGGAHCAGPSPYVGIRPR